MRHKLSRLSPFLALAIFVCCAGFAKADSISSFSMNATLFAGPVADGTFTVDTTTGTFTSGEVTIDYDGQSLTLNKIQSESSSNGFTNVVLGSSSSPGNTFDLVLPAAGLKGYGGGAIASTANYLLDSSVLQYGGFPDLATGGVLTLNSVSASSTGVGATGAPSVAQTPEVGTLVLVLTGLLAGMFLLRGRSDKEREAVAAQAVDGFATTETLDALSEAARV